jgi:hypothetical protein
LSRFFPRVSVRAMKHDFCMTLMRGNDVLRSANACAPLRA